MQTYGERRVQGLLGAEAGRVNHPANFWQQVELNEA